MLSRVEGGGGVLGRHADLEKMAKKKLMVKSELKRKEVLFVLLNVIPYKCR